MEKLKQILTHAGKAAKLVVTDLAKLESPTLVTALAGVLAPIVLGLTGLDYPPAVIGGWLTLVGGAAAMLQKVASGKTAPPAPPLPPPLPPAPAKVAKPKTK